MPGIDLTCEECSKPVTATQFRDGTSWDASLIAQNALRKFGQQLCMDCYRRRNKQGRAQESRRRRNITDVMDELVNTVSALEAIELANKNQHTAEVLRGLLTRVRELRAEVVGRNQAVPLAGVSSLGYVEGESNANVPGDTSPEAPSSSGG
jgi:hypothetical protein